VTFDAIQALELALEHHQAGRLAEAERIYKQVLEVDPNHPQALHLLGLIAHQCGKHELAIELIEKTIRIDPSKAHYRNNLGEAYRAVGRAGDAEQQYGAALLLNPAYTEAHNNLGNALLDLGRLEEAEQSYRRALSLKPNYVEAHNNLGIALLELGRLEEAERSYRRALSLRPNYVETHVNLGGALEKMGRQDEAERLYRQALALRPNYARAHSNLANVLKERGRLEEAEQSCRQAIAFEPNLAEAHHSLGNVLKEAGRLEEAERCYRQALIHKPKYPASLASWVHMRQLLCAWAGLDESLESLRRSVETPGSQPISPFIFLTCSDTDRNGQRDCARQFVNATLKSVISSPPLFKGKRNSVQPRLRVGYLSADFREHPTSSLLAEVIERHERQRFEVFGYSYGPSDSSSMQRRIRKAFAVFRDIRFSSDNAAAQTILDDGIDLLVDLKGYTAGGRPGITALRPAPVQISWLGYPGTLGDRRLADYLIGDSVVTPLQHAEHYSELLALMPGCYQPNDRQREIGEAPTRTDVGLPEDGFVFCSFNQSYKITRVIFDVWCRLLHQVPGSVLWLLESTATARRNLLHEAETRGIAGERIVFGPHLAPTQHLGRLQLADLALDTYPITSHTTASDALWVGVPLLTKLGDTFVSRVAASILHAAGLPELVTNDLAAYYLLAVELATKRDRLDAIRARLAANRMSCRLFDSGRFTHDLEHLYRKIWDDYIHGRRQHISPSEATMTDFALFQRERHARPSGT
jgi:predicted O-linked N-acetylglucosamine transferase (SPINDLY family)